MNRNIQSVKSVVAREVGRLVEQYKRDKSAKHTTAENTTAQQLCREAHYLRALAASLNSYANMLSREAHFTRLSEQGVDEKRKT